MKPLLAALLCTISVAFAADYLAPSCWRALRAAVSD